MSRNRAILTGLLAAAAMASGCAFKKATPGEINGSGGTQGGNADGGDTNDALSGVGMDINLPEVVDAVQFEAEASQNCIEANPQTMNLPPDVLILLDRSLSMVQAVDGSSCTTTGAGGRGGGVPVGGNGDCGANSKWTLMTTALVNFVQSVTTPVNWGLMFFGNGTSTAGAGACSVATTANVAPGPMTADMIATAIAATRPATSTPTANAETAAAAYLGKLNDGNPKFILLATDGIPTCGNQTCLQAGMGNTCDDMNAIAAVQAAHDTAMIPTFVLGIGSDLGGGEATLTSMATVGGFPRANATPAYYPIGSAADLQAAFTTITGMVGGCFFSVSPVPKSATDITGVTGDGNPIPQDATDGWTFTTMGAVSGVQLNGKSCDDYKNKVIQNVVVQLPCIIP